MKVIFDHSEDVAFNTKTFWFRADPKPEYLAGQFIEIFLPHANPDSRGQKRWFTLSSSPSERLLSITTKLADKHSSSFKKILFGLKPGTNLTMSEPMGDFVLPKDSNIPLLFVAGGIGITPVRSIIKWLLDNKLRRNIYIIYATHTLEEIAFRDLFDTYNADIDIFLSNPPQNWTGKRGHLSAKTILSLNTAINPLIYVSGPEELVEKLESELLQEHITPSRLVLDFYPGYKTLF
jgi:glycine betaine catabolism B